MTATKRGPGSWRDGVCLCATVAGGALFALSFTLPAWRPHSLYGWEAFGAAIGSRGGLLGILSALANLLVPVAVFRSQWAAWTGPAMAGATVLNVLYWPVWALSWSNPVNNLLAGYWCWVLAFACVTLGLLLRPLPRAPAA